MLVLLGAKIQNKDHYASTPLHDAALSGRTATAAFLLDSNASVDPRNNRCITFIHIDADEEKHGFSYAFGKGGKEGTAICFRRVLT